MEIKINELMAAPVRIGLNGARAVMSALFDNEAAIHNADGALEDARLIHAIDYILHDTVVDKNYMQQRQIIDITDTAQSPDSHAQNLVSHF